MPTTTEVAGARIATTEYTFRVIEPLKGCAPGALVFRQVGRRGGGGADLGALVGLPVYDPGAQYVLLLVPESRIGLTSPAGGGQGAYRIVGQGTLVPLRAAPRTTAAAAAASGADAVITYDDLRSVVRKGGSR